MSGRSAVPLLDDGRRIVRRLAGATFADDGSSPVGTIRRHAPPDHADDTLLARDDAAGNVRPLGASKENRSVVFEDAAHIDGKVSSSPPEIVRCLPGRWFEISAQVTATGDAVRRSTHARGLSQGADGLSL